MSNDPSGSIWRKWDLQVHAPGTKLNDNYKINDNENICDVFCDKIEKSDVEVFGITDYFSPDCYNAFIEKFRLKYPESRKKFFLNIELRLNESVGIELEEVNIHLIFNPLSLGKVNKFLTELKIVKTGENEKPINCAELRTNSDYESATVTREAIQNAFEETFGKKARRRDHFLVFTAANCIRAKQGVKRKEIISDEIDKFSDGFFGGMQNQQYFLNIERLEDKAFTIGKKPVITSSDAHSFDDLDNFLGRRVEEKGENGKDIIIKDVTWIKADPTFEGLKQILYEPEPGERVCIGPTEPETKNEYQVIRKIEFHNTNDFPEEIVFNKNLCSIIGSRSSGKSALLAYIAHSIDTDLAESLVKGPGEGEDYHWAKIKLEYSVEWRNGLSNNESPGKIVYIPQNYLFDETKDPEKLKRRIEPILFKHFPNFEMQYKQAMNNIDIYNRQITEHIEKWFGLSDVIKSLKEMLKELGDKRIVEKEKHKIESEIEVLKKKYQLSESDVKLYQGVSTTISDCEIKIRQIKREFSQIEHVSKETPYFSVLTWNFIPELDGLPQKLQQLITTELQKNSDSLLETANRYVIDYKKSIEQEKTVLEEKIAEIKKNNKTLLEKYQKNVELEDLIKKRKEYDDTLENIKITDSEKKSFQIKLTE